jgi:hypothetical protein
MLQLVANTTGSLPNDYRGTEYFLVAFVRSAVSEWIFFNVSEYRTTGVFIAIQHFLFLPVDKSSIIFS